MVKQILDGVDKTNQGTGIGEPIFNGIEGSVLFVDDELNLAQDNSNLFWDNLNKILELSESRTGDSTNFTSISSTGDISQTGSARRNWTKYTANSITLTDITVTGTVSDLQTANDGNVLNVHEAAGSAGQNIIIDFINIIAFNWVKILSIYQGGTTHALQIQLFNWNTVSWDNFGCNQTGFSNTGTIFCNGDFITIDDTDYIGTILDLGKVRVRFIHPVAGNAAHDWFIDEVSLRQ